MTRSKRSRKRKANKKSRVRAERKGTSTPLERRNPAVQQYFSAAKVSESLQEKSLSLVQYNFLLVLYISVLYVLPFLIYRNTRADELFELLERYNPVIFSALVFNISLTLFGRSLFPIETVKKAYRYNVFLKVKALVSTVVIALASYPLVSMSGVGEFVAQWVYENFQFAAQYLQPYLSRFIDWTVSGISGWIGHIFLGALGSGLWSFIFKALSKRKRKG